MQNNITKADLGSGVWSRLTKDFQVRLQELRESNDYPLLTPEKTALIRGQISEVKRLLALSESAGMSGVPLIGDTEPSDF